jgi:FHS family L-fucose permease-like MFS transporter
VGGGRRTSLILPKLADPVDIASLTPAQLHTIRMGKLGAVIGPYLGPRLAADLEDAVAKDKLPPRADTGSHTQRGRVPPLASRLSLDPPF